MEEFTFKEFIKKTISEIEAAVPDNYELDDSIDFEVSITTSKGSSGGIDIKIVSGKLSEEKEITHKIEFSISNIKQQEKKVNDLIKNFNTFFLSLKELSNKLNLKDQPPELLK